MTKSDVDRF